MDNSYEDKTKKECKEAFDAYLSSPKEEINFQMAELKMLSSIAVNMGVIADKLNK